MNTEDWKKVTQGNGRKMANYCGAPIEVVDHQPKQTYWPQLTQARQCEVQKKSLFGSAVHVQQPARVHAPALIDGGQYPQDNTDRIANALAGLVQATAKATQQILEASAASPSPFGYAGTSQQQNRLPWQTPQTDQRLRLLDDTGDDDDECEDSMSEDDETLSAMIRALEEERRRRRQQRRAMRK